MQDEWFFYIIVAGIAFAMGIISGRTGRRDPHTAEMMMLMQQEMVHQDLQRRDSGNFVAVLLFLFILIIIAAVVMRA